MGGIGVGAGNAGGGFGGQAQVGAGGGGFGNTSGLWKQRQLRQTPCGFGTGSGFGNASSKLGHEFQYVWQQLRQFSYGQYGPASARAVLVRAMASLRASETFPAWARWAA